MELSEDHRGIVELPADAVIGAPAAHAMGLGDPLFDVAITPNRGDCLSVRGIARDLAAAGMGTLKPLAQPQIEGRFASPISVSLDFPAGAAGACPYFVGRMIRGVRNGESPKWLQDRLTAIGLRPISALVDLTNYLTYDLCRPLHVFDADKLRGDLRVRLARPGETLRALNGIVYALDAEMTVIADAEAAEALGGVMGGERTGVTPETRNVFIESALFDPVRTARTGRTLNILSDARFRFERGIDPSFLITGIEIATAMLCEICGGEPSHLVIAGGEPPTRPPVRFRPGRVGTLTGAEVPAEESDAILGALGFAVDAGDEPWSVSVPRWRNDVDSEACLVEEVVRIAGFHRIPAVPLPRTTALPASPLTAAQARRALVRRLLAGRGLIEAVTLSFMAAPAAELFGGAPDGLKVVNPISNDLDLMRPSILPNLLLAAGRNADRGLRDAALFEIGPQYAGSAPEQQAMVAAGIRSGRAVPRHWAVTARGADAFDVKADCLAILEGLGAPVEKLMLAAEAPSWYHPGRSGCFRLGPKAVLAQFGEIHPAVLARFDQRTPVAGFEVFLDALPAPKPRRGSTRTPLKSSTLQPVERDFAFVVDGAQTADAIVAAVRRAAPELVRDVHVFDVFTGGGLAENEKSMALSVVLQPIERTLTDAEIEAVAQKIVTSVAQATGGVLRT
jgi:phenylalanyl-tRNA synthetase beta chain